MGFEGFAALALAINLVSALCCSFIASRTGHDAFSWALTGAVIGPFAVIALLARRRRGEGGVVPAGTQGSVLIPTDGSEPSLAAVDHFAAAHGRGSTVTLLAVLPVERRGETDAELSKDIESHIGEARRRLQLAGVTCRVATAFGDPATEIVKMAGEGKFDHILMGRRGRGGVAKLLLGSVSEKVVKEAPIPVTVAG